ncbi:uncharacterized protein PV09_00418 [Verruconis gallopava]|uniref:Copper acquisition factor BIM1-like domain-containing protein n=1 Tax=Verruconis gallopava TaxID=253628 RepID=A0A0D2ASU4_9PEZI|nr:uncharacterized protein PV09_00418 [Verruconis gallopava]KIW09545.1 hypothetical protein PV09_00418 [Verruconis gallopava]
MFSRALLLSILPIVSAHFHLVWPPSRGFDEDTIVNYPCGGFDQVNSTRQALPLNGAFPIQLNMEHTSVKGMVVLAVGNNPTGDDFTTVLKPTFEEVGPQNFCIGDVIIPASLNLTEGTNATIQVLTNGDPNGGLYQCADVTFTSATLSQTDYNSHCSNSTGVSASFVGGAAPNGTSSSSSSQSSSSASGSASGTAASKTSSGSGTRQTAGALLLGAAGVLAVGAL